MDIRNLPDAEREIYNRIKKKYRLTFDKLTVKDKTLRLLKIADLGEFIGDNPQLEKFLRGKMSDPQEFLQTLQDTDVSDFPFWIRLWDAAIVLSYLLTSLPQPQGKTLLELGAGLGAPGLAAASAGMDVTITDYEEMIVDFQRVSAAASGLTNVNFALFDWFAPPELKQYDILAAAEVVFREEFFEPLLNVFKKHLKPDGAIWLAHDASRRNLPKFLQLAKNDFDIAINKQEFKKEGKDIVIIVNRLTFKK